MKDKIHGWLLQTGLQVQETPLKEDSFRFSVRDQRGLGTEVFQPNALNDCVLIIAAVNVSPEHSQLLDTLPEAEREHFLWDLRLALDGAGTDFDGVQHPIKQILLSQQIYYDGLTKDTFFQRWGAVRRAALLCIWTINRRLNGLARMTAASVN